MTEKQGICKGGPWNGKEMVSHKPDLLPHQFSGYRMNLGYIVPNIRIGRYKWKAGAWIWQGWDDDA